MSEKKSLVIVESPAKARTISKYLGSGFQVEASIGHIRDLPGGAKEVPAEFKSEGNILFVEDIDEYLYNIDRMMMNLKYGGKLHNLKGIIVGDMTDMKDNNIPFGKNAYEIISDVLSGYDIPVCYGFPAGHGHKNWPLIMGHTVTLNVSDKCGLKFL